MYHSRGAGVRVGVYEQVHQESEELVRADRQYLHRSLRQDEPPHDPVGVAAEGRQLLLALSARVALPDEGQAAGGFCLTI